MGGQIEQLIAMVYPLAAVCSHKETKPSLEFEEEDEDNGHYIIVNRCVVCSLPISSDEVTMKEVDEYYANKSN